MATNKYPSLETCKRLAELGIGVHDGKILTEKVYNTSLIGEPDMQDLDDFRLNQVFTSGKSIGYPCPDVAEMLEMLLWVEDSLVIQKSAHDGYDIGYAMTPLADWTNSPIRPSLAESLATLLIHFFDSGYFTSATSLNAALYPQPQPER